MLIDQCNVRGSCREWAANESLGASNMPTKPLTEAEYWEDVQLLSNEIEDAVAVFQTYEAINQAALEDAAIFRLLNEDALFWNVQVHSLQMSLFMVLGRIFDSASDAHSIHRVVNATLGHLEFFSKEALTARRMEGGSKPEWLGPFVAGAWVPSTAADIRHLKKELGVRHNRFEETYRPIRHAIFAHRLMTNARAALELFPKTNRDEIAAILDFLHDLIGAIRDLYLNGARPQLGVRLHKDYNDRIKASTKSVLCKLATRSPAEETD
jgi:hypothetical protein